MSSASGSTNDFVINSGCYSVHEIKEDQPTIQTLRFSFTYRRQAGRWLIVNNHSFAPPVAP